MAGVARCCFEVAEAVVKLGEFGFVAVAFGDQFGVTRLDPAPTVLFAFELSAGLVAFTAKLFDRRVRLVELFTESRIICQVRAIWIATRISPIDNHAWLKMPSRRGQPRNHTANASVTEPGPDGNGTAGPTRWRRSAANDGELLVTLDHRIACPITCAESEHAGLRSDAQLQIAISFDRHNKQRLTRWWTDPKHEALFLVGRIDRNLLDHTARYMEFTLALILGRAIPLLARQPDDERISTRIRHHDRGSRRAPFAKTTRPSRYDERCHGHHRRQAVSANDGHGPTR